MTIEEKIKAYPTQIFSRVCGWYTARDNMNKGKRAERKDMKVYKIKENE